MSMQLGAKRPVTDINVTPLIDVVLVLLIIFMVLTPLAEKQMFMRVPEYEPPNTQVVPPESVPPDQIVLTALKNGRVLLNKQDLTVDEAMAKLKPVFEGHYSKVLFFNAQDGTRYEFAVKVLDEAHKAGVNTIGMMTDPPMVEAVGEGAAGGAPAAPPPAPPQ
ncbi:MAG TPA: biopolymer transporter ExbD [Anaeromyxobacteraceae bacterium]|nr:biopolymer transporter ExbD [Anaeromyxobacteraceae bacterium]